VCSGGASVIRRDGVERLHRESGPRVPSSAGNSPGVSNFAARRGAARRASGFAGLIFSRGVRGVRQRRRIANQARRISIGDEEAVKKLTVRNFRKKGKIRLRDEAALPPPPPCPLRILVARSVFRDRSRPTANCRVQRSDKYRRGVSRQIESVTLLAN